MQINEMLCIVQRAREAGDGPFSRDGWRVERVRSGMNNALYRAEGSGEVYAVKLCVADERRRAQREHAALRLLARAGLDIAPQPVGLDESRAIVPYPVVVYRWLQGEPLGGAAPGRALPAGWLAALLESVQRMHSITPQAEAGLPEAWFHWFEREAYQRELEESLLGQYRNWLCENVADGRAICARLERIITACRAAFEASPARIDRASVPLRLCHVDPNPANAIWGADGRLRWVDWEYSGWGDPALELAEFGWHEALAFMSAEQTAWMRASYRLPPGDEGFEARLALWEALLAARWPLLLLRWLWSIHNGPDRQRLSMPQAQAGAVHRRMLELIQRAEKYLGI